ncbi:zinc import ATP-binding protein ZnuC [Amylibacter marinus]|uniref:Zinc import ATP-binding protein ZnuC n=1 Tax=Amylibacter marinus TaxID=1475483 RepID=A0ABQ5VS03_9RHOB|nr:metal ABC transporter ATP-binding protein [Amylibacter marinus]GLQ34205.1 zinc import ATP-binding protein ZnuC [Amylibacter marinus]
MRLITTNKLTVQHGRQTALHSVDFHIDSKEIVTVVGPNGSGKSTLMRTLVGAIDDYAGSIERKARLSIGYVPQKLDIDRNLPLTVERFLRLPHRYSRAEIDASLAQVNGADLRDKQMIALSGGQFRRALLARAILGRPELLILDEPTTGLDQSGSANFYKLIEEVRHAMGCAVLMVSHELHVVMAASDRVICLNGHVCCHGTPEVVANAPQYQALFGTGSMGALALYRHEHDHSHDHPHIHGAECDAKCDGTS